ncbi:hypothetical protein LOD99_10653 [Oopsacas minuta]|uniref:Uncharacterized protein n=1 Tax=Oopsacas minuta TaxID=111878 RepID=A0AAV7KHY5_9METZ|nr:hypothetical protein LOD99_10653 [Oopsacas minuta]
MADSKGFYYSNPPTSKRKSLKNSTAEEKFVLTISELNTKQGRCPPSNPPPISPNKPQFSILYPEQDRILTGPVKQPVMLIWTKQQDTINNYVTYFDNLDNPCNLEWDKLKELYSALVHLTCGEHRGCLALSDRDITSEIQSFSVIEKSQTQSVILSIVKSQVKPGLVKSKHVPNPKLGEKKREGEELQHMREEREKLIKEITSISAQLQKEKDSSKIYKKEIISLRDQVDKLKKKNADNSEVAAGERNEARLREARLEDEIKKLKNPVLDEAQQNNSWKHVNSASDNPVPAKTAPKSSDYINFDTLTQYTEYYTEFKELEKSKNNLSKAKTESETKAARLLDFQHEERKKLEIELTQTKKELSESKQEIEKLKENVHRPPLPARSPKLPISPASQQQCLTHNYK